ncbi:MAG: hypothetical protein ACLUKN_17550 [Bacilli bacterium]
MDRTWENPVALVRTNWNIGEGLYLGIKGGKGNLSHAHLDAGSFVFDSKYCMGCGFGR